MKGDVEFVVNHDTVLEVLQKHLIDNVFSSATVKMHIKKLLVERDTYTNRCTYTFTLIDQKDEFESKLKGTHE